MKNLIPNKIIGVSQTSNNEQMFLMEWKNHHTTLISTGEAFNSYTKYVTIFYETINK